MHTNETRGLWPTLPNGLGYELNCSGTNEKKTHFPSPLCSSSFRIRVARDCFLSREPRGAAGLRRQAGPRPCEGPVPDLEGRGRYGPASRTLRRPSSSRTAPAAAGRRTWMLQRRSDIRDFFFFKFQARYRSRFLSSKNRLLLRTLTPRKP